MNWITLIEIIYAVIVALVCLRIIYDTRSSSKTLAYLLLAVFVPVVGIIFYFVFGINYRKRLIYTKKLIADEVVLKELDKRTLSSSARILKKHAIEVGNGHSLVNLIMNESRSPLTSGNVVKLLINGEGKFPEVIEVLKNAKHHIHLEYYIFEEDEIGGRIKEILMQKALEGIQVRMIYDGFGSSSISGELIDELRLAGAEVFSIPSDQTSFICKPHQLPEPSQDHHC